MTLRNQGLVSQVFTEHDLRTLAGDFAIGHVRYSTTGSSAWENAQPVHVARRQPPRARARPQRQPRSTPSSCTRSCAARARVPLDVGLGDHRRAARHARGRRGRGRRRRGDAAAAGRVLDRGDDRDRVVAFRDPHGLRAARARPARRPLLRRQRDVRARHHRRRAAARRRARRDRLADRQGHRDAARSSPARARRSASSSTSTSRGPTR